MYLKEEEQKDEKNSPSQTKKSHTNAIAYSNASNRTHNTIITLRKRSEIAMVFKTGKWFRGASVSLVVGRNISSHGDSETCRFLITTKGIKNKPKRNQLKRKVREHIRNFYRIITSPEKNKEGIYRDIAFIASNPNISFTALGSEMHTLLQRASIIKNK